MRAWLLASLVLFLVLGAAGTASAQSSEESDQLVGVNPDYPEPTPVAIGLSIRDISNIDEREETFEVDGVLVLVWTDPRLAFEDGTFGSERVYQDETALEKLKTEIWWPGIEIVDSRGARDTLSLAITVQSDGLVFYEERLAVTITQSFNDNLDDFPFDSHDISMTIESFSQQNDRVVFASLEEFFELPPWETEEWSITEWDIGGVNFTPDIQNFEAEYLDGELSFASSTLAFEISRVSTFYVTNIILPLLLMVAISWAVFWMNLDTINLAERLGVSITSLLTVVAFDFLTNDNLPRLPFATRLDALYNIAYVLIAGTVLLSVVAHNLHRRSTDRAARLDRWARWLYPVVSVAAVVAALSGLL